MFIINCIIVFVILWQLHHKLYDYFHIVSDCALTVIVTKYMSITYCTILTTHARSYLSGKGIDPLNSFFLNRE